MNIINVIFLIIICVFCNGCVGFINGYMADSFGDQEMEEIRASCFPAINSDTAVLCKYCESEDFNVAQKMGFAAIIGIDYPLSACVDILFLPIKGLAYAKHGRPKIQAPKGNSNKAATGNGVTAVPEL